MLLIFQVVWECMWVQINNKKMVCHFGIPVGRFALFILAVS